mmetsp:Transcript_32120/g.97120  ORF Transcript_32120/g.97120 Transcript_32120/m.97120 type:complete len:320 (-) Transcript_32120:1252-2211(-)
MGDPGGVVGAGLRGERLAAPVVDGAFGRLRPQGRRGPGGAPGAAGGRGPPSERERRRVPDGQAAPGGGAPPVVLQDEHARAPPAAPHRRPVGPGGHEGLRGGGAGDEERDSRQAGDLGVRALAVLQRHRHGQAEAVAVLRVQLRFEQRGGLGRHADRGDGDAGEGVHRHDDEVRVARGDRPFGEDHRGVRGARHERGHRGGRTQARQLAEPFRSRAREGRQTRRARGGRGPGAAHRRSAWKPDGRGARPRGQDGGQVGEQQQRRPGSDRRPAQQRAREGGVGFHRQGRREAGRQARGRAGRQGALGRGGPHRGSGRQDQ